LGVSRDRESGKPVLLMPVLIMELMDSNLTQFLEQSASYCYPPVQPSNQLLGGHQPHVSSSIFFSSSSPPWTQADGGGRLDQQD